MSKDTTRPVYDYADARQVTLGFREFGSSATLNLEALQDHVSAIARDAVPDVKKLRTSVVMDEVARGLVFALRGSVPSSSASSVSASETVEVPRGWWQHLKQDLFPRWLLRLSPVKKRRVVVTVTVDRHVLYRGLDEETSRSLVSSMIGGYSVLMAPIKNVDVRFVD
jgi:hypothetical protein